MLPITNMLFPVNEFSRPGTKLKSKKAVVMHYTASNGAPAKNIANYFGGLRFQDPNDNVDDRYASAHFAVDDNSIVRALPEDEMAYHVGSTTYTKEALNQLSSYPNNCTIGIEMCLDKNGNITEATFQNSADLAAYLCKTYGLDENDIWTHKGVVGWKDCPLPWVKNPSEFARFKSEVAKRLKPPVVVPPPYRMSDADIEKVTRYLSAGWFTPVTATGRTQFSSVADAIRKAQNIPQEEAKKAILFLGAGWQFVEDAADKKEFNRLANEVRKAAKLALE